MKFSVQRKLLDGVFSSTIRFESYGSTEMTPEQEKALFESISPVEIVLKGQYEETFSFDEAQNKIVVDPEGFKVQVFITPQQLKLDEKLVYTIIERTEEQDGQSYADSRKIAEAKAVLRETVVLEKIDEKIKELHNKKTNFEHGTRIVTM